MNTLKLETNLHFHNLECGRNTYEIPYDEKALAKLKEIANKDVGCVLEWCEGRVIPPSGQSYDIMRGFDEDGDFVARIKECI